MATVYVSMGQAGSLPGGNGQPVFRGNVQSETISSSGTAASGSLVAEPGSIAKVTCATAVYATGKGDASATNGVYVAANVAEFLALEAGDVISVIDA